MALAALLFVSSAHCAPGNSDGATVILEGKAMSGGNMTLDHWALSLDSFWLVDVPLYALAVMIRGVRPELLHLVPAAVAAAVIAMGAWIAQRGRTGWAAWLGAGSVVVLLGLPTHAFARFFLMGPLHVTTMLWCLLAFVALRRGRFGWGWLLAVVLLAAGLLGDLQAAGLGGAPVGAAGLVTIWRTREWRIGVPAVSAALGGVGSHPFSPSALPPALEVAHAVGLALAITAVVLALVPIVVSGIKGPRQQLSAGHSTVVSSEVTWLEDVLALAFLAGCAFFAVLSFMPSSVSGR